MKLFSFCWCVVLLMTLSKNFLIVVLFVWIYALLHLGSMITQKQPGLRQTNVGWLANNWHFIWGICPTLLSPWKSLIRLPASCSVSPGRPSYWYPWTVSEQSIWKITAATYPSSASYVSGQKLLFLCVCVWYLMVEQNVLMRWLCCRSLWFKRVTYEAGVSHKDVPEPLLDCHCEYWLHLVRFLVCPPCALVSKIGVCWRE